MKKIIHKISTVVFLLYFIGVTMGINLSIHFCGGEVADISVLQDVGHCDIGEGTSCNSNLCHTLNTEKHKGCHSDAEHNCCSDKHVFIALETPLLFSSYNFSFDSSVQELLDNKIEIIEVNTGFPKSFSDSEKTQVSYPPPYLVLHKLIFYA